MNSSLFGLLLAAFCVAWMFFMCCYRRRKHKVCVRPHYELGALIINDKTIIYNLNNEKMAQTVLTTQQPFQVVFQNPVDADGQPAVASGQEFWLSNNEAVATVEQDSSNPLQATITLTGAVGVVDLVITDPETGVTGTASIEVVEPVAPIADFGEPTFLGIDA